MLRNVSLILITTLTSACQISQPVSGSAIDRLKAPAEAHAAALIGSDVGAMRVTGAALLERLGALAGW